MPRSTAVTRRRFVGLIAASSVGSMLASIGCGPNRPVAAKVDPNQAREALDKVLAAWRDGGSPNDCRDWTPPIVVQDIDWTGGSKLLDFRVESEVARDANLYATVELTLESPEGGRSVRKIDYCVGTDPVLTVFRSYG
ncbi:MAG TPA: hypothetical protein DCQ98_15435 [Planctomycetaceae bacterium]|nr:hypothetical protein [Planctomycetaceae bacterium]